MRTAKLFAGAALFVFAGLLATPAMAAGALISTPIRGTYIYITHRDNPDIAANIGMSRCMGRYGSGCRVLKVYESGCLAVAQSSDGSHHSGWAVKGSSHDANLLAIGECAKYGGSCHLDVNICE
jgi:Domain of unknown function (DUF4189)